MTYCIVFIPLRLVPPELDQLKEKVVNVSLRRKPLVSKDQEDT